MRHATPSRTAVASAATPAGPAVRQQTPVNAMLDPERAAWIDTVWGLSSPRRTGSDDEAARSWVTNGRDGLSGEGLA
jgi:hypothetical protein